MTNLSNIKPQGGDKKSFLKILNYKEYCSQSIIYRRKGLRLITDAKDS